MRTFVYSDGKSNKFWNIDLQGTRFYTTFGKAGTRGQTRLKEFATEAEAREARDRAVAEKLREGYVETTEAKPVPPPVGTPLRLSMETALIENPDDLVTHSAYADYLMEQGDPRGEFIQVQLALEDESRPPAERTRLQARESELLKKHGKQWLGEAGRFLWGDWSGPDKPWHYSFVRGWLDHVRLLPCPDAALAALARSPEARLLRRLEVVYDMRYHPFRLDPFLQGPVAALAGDESENETYEEANVLPPLLASPYLGKLRSLKLGFSDHPTRMVHSTMISLFEGITAAQMVELLQKCPHLEEFFLNTSVSDVSDLFASPVLGNLRLFQYYYGTDYDLNESRPAYPLAALTNNPSLGRLEALRFHPGRDEPLGLEELTALLQSPNLPSLIYLQANRAESGNDACRRVVESRILRRLKVLCLAYSDITDEGAMALAASPDLVNLDALDLTHNALTEAGIAALRATGVDVVVDDQYGPDDEANYYDSDVE